METSNQKIPDIFANNYFRIPDYQRGYAWKADKQLPDLWDDIEDIPTNPSGGYKPHYTGAISLQKTSFDKLSKSEQKLLQSGSNIYDVVDGQQRLTTILILLFELYKKLNDKKIYNQYIKEKGKNAVYKFSYGTENGDYNYFLRKEIFEDPNSICKGKSVYTNNLREAKQFFCDKLAPLTPKQARRIFSKVTTALMFDIKIIDDSFDVQAVFETMNNRGKPLTILEKLKNRLLFLNSKLTNCDNEQLAKIINDCWGLIYNSLGQNETSMLDEDEFLSSHLTLIRTPADYSFSTQDAERKVFEMFCSRASQYRLSYTRDQSESSKKEEVVSFDKIKKYAIDLANYVPYWFTVNCPDIKNTVELELYKIQCLNGSKEMRLFLAQLLALQKDEPEEFNRCLKNVEKILFRNRLPIPSIMDERSFATRARDLHIGDIKLEELNNELEAILAQTIECSSLIGGFKWLFTYVRGNVGYHRWNGLKYFLFEFEEHIHQQDYSRDFAIISWDKFFETSIEHIMPKTYQDYWSDTMSNYLSQKSFSEEERYVAIKTLLNSLGNLTIIRDKKNSSLGNNPWETKVKAYANGSFSERQISSKTEWHPWSAESILNRGKVLLKYLIDYLDVVIIAEEKKETYEAEMLFGALKYVPGTANEAEDNSEATATE